MRNEEQLQALIRRDLDDSIELPSRSEWRPSRVARAGQTNWKLAVVIGAAIIIFVLAVAAPLLAGIEQRRTPAESPSPTQSVATPSATPRAAEFSGTVTSAVTGLPIAGATIWLFYDEPECCHIYESAREWITDAGGHFKAVALNGRYKLMVNVALSHVVNSPLVITHTLAYAPRYWGDTGDYKSARLLEISGVDITRLDVSLVLGHSISGRVTGSTYGSPLPTIIAVAAGGSGSCCTWVQVSANDIDGTYRIAVADGVYRIRFRGPPTRPVASYIPEIGAVMPEYPYQWWDGAQDFAGARDIVVKDSDVTGIDAVLPNPNY